MEQTATTPAAVAAKPAELNGQASSPIGLNGTAPAPSKPAPNMTTQIKHYAYMVLERLADLRITVVLFALSLLLVFWGTLAQVDFGVWTIVSKYFRSWVVLVPIRVILFNAIAANKIAIPFPGGWLLGWAMMINLLAAHAMRFKVTWARSGILITHAGIIVMMLGEFITGIYAVEGLMRIQVGQTANTVIDARNAELAIIRTVDNTTDDVIAVPATRLYEGAVVIDDKLPFQIEVTKFWSNSKLDDSPNRALANKGFGLVHGADEAPEVSGVDTDQKFDRPSLYVKLQGRDGSDLGSWLFSTHFTDPQYLEVAGKKYQLLLRYKQTTRPFKMHLTKFDFKVFPGTNTPKDYHSFIRLTDEKGNDRDVEIFMNAPLYYRGETFYQSGMDSDERGVITTTLQVVRNPGWALPYISCFMVGLGLLIHFDLTLYKFIQRRTVR